MSSNPKSSTLPANLRLKAQPAEHGDADGVNLFTRLKKQFRHRKGRYDEGVNTGECANFKKITPEDSETDTADFLDSDRPVHDRRSESPKSSRPNISQSERFTPSNIGAKHKSSKFPNDFIRESPKSKSTRITDLEKHPHKTDNAHLPDLQVGLQGNPSSLIKYDKKNEYNPLEIDKENDIANVCLAADDSAVDIYTNNEHTADELACQPGYECISDVKKRIQKSEFKSSPVVASTDTVGGVEKTTTDDTGVLSDGEQGYEAINDDKKRIIDNDLNSNLHTVTDAESNVEETDRKPPFGSTGTSSCHNIYAQSGKEYGNAAVDTVNCELQPGTPAWEKQTSVGSGRKSIIKCYSETETPDSVHGLNTKLKETCITPPEPDSKVEGTKHLCEAKAGGKSDCYSSVTLTPTSCDTAPGNAAGCEITGLSHRDCCMNQTTEYLLGDKQEIPDLNSSLASTVNLSDISIPPPRPPLPTLVQSDHGLSSSSQSTRSSGDTPPDDCFPFRFSSGGNQSDAADEDTPPVISPRMKAIKQQQADASIHRDFMESMKQLKDCGWYWGPLSYGEAEAKLTNKPEGSFVVRDSSDDRYILSLSFRNQEKISHIHIEHHQGHFRFLSQTVSHGKSTIKDFVEQCMDDSRNGKFRNCLMPSRSGSHPRHIPILHPISRFIQMRSLQHMCRFRIVQHVRRDHIDCLPIPTRIKNYLKEAQYYVEYLDD